MDNIWHCQDKAHMAYKNITRARLASNSRNVIDRKGDQGYQPQLNYVALHKTPRSCKKDTTNKWRKAGAS